MLASPICKVVRGAGGGASSAARALGGADNSTQHSRPAKAWHFVLPDRTTASLPDLVGKSECLIVWKVMITVNQRLVLFAISLLQLRQQAHAAHHDPGTLRHTVGYQHTVAIDVAHPHGVRHEHFRLALFPYLLYAIGTDGQRGA